MSEFMTTQEVARYLHLNPKKVYDLVARNRLPAARISGKWLFSRALIDEWVAAHTIHPSTGLLGALLDEMLVLQGSDDEVFLAATEAYQRHTAASVVGARVGSLGGLRALARGRAHLAACHVSRERIEAEHPMGQDWGLLTLLERWQGIMVDARRTPQMDAPDVLDGSMLRLAQRQPGAGTRLLLERHALQRGWDTSRLRVVGPFHSHLEVGLAVREGRADVGVGTRQAARRCGLRFIPLEEEVYQLVVPLGYVDHDAIVRFLDFLLDHLPEVGRDAAGYCFERTGHMEILRGRSVGADGSGEGTRGT